VNGVYGFKPTATRLPKFGNKVSIDLAAVPVGTDAQSIMVGQESIAGAIGPMARSARDLELFVTTILAAQPWRFDPTQVAMPWRPESIEWRGGTKPKIGIMWHDGVVMPLPPMAKALQAAATRLKAAGFEVKDYAPYRSSEAWDIIVRLPV
jgi:amidase